MEDNNGIAPDSGDTQGTSNEHLLPKARLAYEGICIFKLRINSVVKAI